MAGSDWLSRALSRPRASIVLCLLLLCTLAWLYLISGAGMDAHEAMSGLQGGHTEMAGMGMPHGAAASPASFALTLVMWWIMMVAMMLPSAAPAILLYARVRDHAQNGNAATVPTTVGLFAAAYLLIWLIFSFVAAALQLALAAQHILSPMRMALQSSLAMGLLLVAAGLYQMTPLKAACLAHCRSPAHYFAQHWRPGPAGALRLGMRHGAYCFGCCWMLMLLLFVGGVMNMLLIVALTLVVAGEKLVPWGDAISKFVGTGLIAAGITFLIR